MFRNSMNDEDITDDEFDKIVAPFDKLMTEYIDKNVVPEFVAYYLAKGYNLNALWKNSLKVHCNSSVECLADIRHFDYNKIIEILETKYNLKVINTAPLEFEVIKK